MKNVIRTFFITGVITITGAVAGCTTMTGGTNGSSSSAAFSSAASSATSSEKEANVVISIDDNGFNLPTLTVVKGNTVTWINDGTTAHTVTGDDGGPESETIAVDGTYSYTFNTAGTYTYHCDFHPEMVGVVVVRE